MNHIQTAAQSSRTRTIQHLESSGVMCACMGHLKVHICRAGRTKCLCALCCEMLRLTHTGRVSGAAGGVMTRTTTAIPATTQSTSATTSHHNQYGCHQDGYCYSYS
jgi:hypothetical protein